MLLDKPIHAGHSTGTGSFDYRQTKNFSSRYIKFLSGAPIHSSEAEHISGFLG